AARPSARARQTRNGRGWVWRPARARTARRPGGAACPPIPSSDRPGRSESRSSAARRTWSTARLGRETAESRSPPTSRRRSARSDSAPPAPSRPPALSAPRSPVRSPAPSHLHLPTSPRGGRLLGRARNERERVGAEPRLARAQRQRSRAHRFVGHEVVHPRPIDCYQQHAAVRARVLAGALVGIKLKLDPYRPLRR